ncbi:MAG: protein kinase domain-containing protein [bacterium]
MFDAVRDLPEADARDRVRQHPSEEVQREVFDMLDADRNSGNAVRRIVDVAGAIDEANAPLEIPAMVGEYKVTGLLGQGGGGVVLKGVCPRSGDTVAIKVLGIGAWSSRALGRFRQEIKLLGHLSHPGIAKILDAGTDRSGVSPHPYFVMEFVDGQSLSEWRRATQRTPREIVSLFAEIVEAVAYSHARGITHRDLKPSNILVTAEGHAKILDFGVATVARDADPSLDPLRTLTMMLRFGGDGARTQGAGRTAEGSVVGTLPYMSPEQISGTQLADARSDLYGLGVMLYEALSGKLPYDLSLQSLTDAAMVIRSEIPTTLGRVDRGLRGDLEIIVSRLLEKRPADRYQSAQQLLEDLGRYLSGQRTRVRRLPWHVRMGRFVKRYPAYAASLAVFAAIAVGSLGYVTHLVVTERLERARRATELEVAMRFNLSSAAFEVDKGQLGTSRTSLAAVPESKRNWAWRALGRFLDMGSLQSCVFYGPYEIKSRGDLLFVREGEAGVSTAVFDLRETTRRGVDSPYASAPIAISPDGTRCVRAYAPDGWLLVRAVADGIALNAIESPLASIDDIDWSNDGTTIALANRAGLLAAVDLETGAVKRANLEWRGGDAGRVFVRMVDGVLMAAVEGDDAMFAWRLRPSGAAGRTDAAEAAPRRVPLAALTMNCLASASIDGEARAFVGTREGSVLVVDPSDGSITRTIPFASSPIVVVAVEPRRGLLVAGCGDRPDQRRGTLRVWDLATGELAGTVSLRSSPRSLGFSEDGESLFIGETSGELMRCSVLQEVLVPSVGSVSRPVGRMAFADGGRMVVSNAEGVFWWNWDRDRQASRTRLERWPLASDAVAGRPFAVLSFADPSADATRRAVLAVADGASGVVRFFAESGAEVGRTGIEAPMSTDAPLSIAATERGFVLGAGGRFLHYAVTATPSAVRAELLGSCELPSAVRSVSSTPNARKAVATVAAAGGSPAMLVGIEMSKGGAPEVVWQSPLGASPESTALDAAIAADGSCAITVTGDADIAIYEAEQGANIFVALDFAPWNIDRDAVDLAMSPDGRALAVRFIDGSVRLIEAPEAPASNGGAP